MSAENSFYRSGELAELAGVSTDTLRHYERKGVLARPLRKANDYLQYPATALPRVRLIRRALAVGFTLDELATVLSECDRGGAPCMEVRALAAAKLAEVETRLREMAELRNELKTVLKDWDKRLEQESRDILRQPRCSAPTSAFEWSKSSWARRLSLRHHDTLMS